MKDKKIEADTENSKIQSELAVFWEQIASNLPKNRARAELGDRRIFEAFASAYPDIRSHLLNLGIAQEKARAKKKLNPFYNRPVALKERVDREAELENTVRQIHTGNNLFTDAQVGVSMGEDGLLKYDWNRETEFSTKEYVDKQAWQGLGKTKQPSLWERVKGIISIGKYLP